MHIESLLKIMRPHSSWSLAVLYFSNERAPNHGHSSLPPEVKENYVCLSSDRIQNQPGKLIPQNVEYI